MEEFVINKCEITPEDVFLTLGNALSIYLYIVSGLSVGFIPLIAIMSLKMFYNLILHFRWYKSCAITVNPDKIIFNHTLLLKNVPIPLSSIDFYDKSKRFIKIKASQNGMLPLFYKSGFIGLYTLTHTECRELFKTLDMYFK